jgi:hypothetical protein
MRLHDFVAESKNVIFNDTESFDPSGAVPGKIHKFITDLLKPLKFSRDNEGNTVSPVGSAHTPRRSASGATVASNDWDSQIDLDDVMRAFPADLSHLGAKKAASLEARPEEKQRELVKQSKQLFADWLRGKGLEVKIIGITAYVKVPVAGKFYEADLEMVRNRNQVKDYHRHNIPAGSAFKGVHKQIFLRMLAKSQGKLWSPWEGLFGRDANDKKADLIATDPVKIARSLFGKSATARTLDSIENMMAALPADQAQRLLDQARQDPSWL